MEEPKISTRADILEPNKKLNDTIPGVSKDENSTSLIAVLSAALPTVIGLRCNASGRVCVSICLAGLYCASMVLPLARAGSWWNESARCADKANDVSKVRYPTESVNFDFSHM